MNPQYVNDKNLIRFMIGIIVVYYSYKSLNWVYGYFNTPHIEFYQVSSKSKEEWMINQNKPFDTIYSKYYTYVIDGYRDFKQYHQVIDSFFCNLRPSNIEKYYSFSANFYFRSKYTMEDMDYNTFNRRYEHYRICGYNVTNGKDLIEAYYYNDKNSQGDYKKTEFSCK
ncbi:MAG: hypothetical protein ABIO44_01370 [Saprospiraceae bacterium]